MKTFGNVIWLLLFGLWEAIALFLLGCLFCLTLVGIPLGLKCIKMANLALWPFGKTVEANFEEHPVGNAVWLSFGGLGMAAGCYVAGIILCITLIGIPFAKQYFKLARYAISPFGASFD